MFVITNLGLATDEVNDIRFYVTQNIIDISEEMEMGYDRCYSP